MFEQLQKVGLALPADGTRPVSRWWEDYRRSGALATKNRPIHVAQHLPVWRRVVTIPGMRPSFAFTSVVLLAMFTTQLFAGINPDRLKRGVNLSHWYAQWGTYDEERLATYFNERDMKLVAQMGFSHVRLTLSESIVFDPATPGVLKQEPLQRLKQRIDRIVDHKIAVVVDLHPETPYKKALQDDPKHADAFVADWAALAKALADTDPTWVALEVMNEPDPNQGEAWRALQLRAAEAIRAAAPEHTIIVSPGTWTSSKDLAEFKPYDMKNLIYTFHYYEPHIYTHQSASWGWIAAQQVKDLDWPIEPSDAERVTNAATADPEARKHLKWQIEQGWFTPEWIGHEFDKIVLWQKTHGNPPVYLGEFGVYTKATPRVGRLKWYEAVRKAAEERGFAWAIWDYAGGFQVVEGKPGERVPDVEMLKALGLK